MKRKINPSLVVTALLLRIYVMVSTLSAMAHRLSGSIKGLRNAKNASLPKTASRPVLR